MIQIDTWRGRETSWARAAAWRVTQRFAEGAVSFRIHKLWRPDNRFPGEVMVRRHESGGVELSFSALRHGAKPRPPVVVAPDSVDAFIVSLLSVRVPKDTDNRPMDEEPFVL